MYTVSVAIGKGVKIPVSVIGVLVTSQRAISGLYTCPQAKVPIGKVIGGSRRLDFGEIIVRVGVACSTGDGSMCFLYA